MEGADIVLWTLENTRKLREKNQDGLPTALGSCVLSFFAAFLSANYGYTYLPTIPEFDNHFALPVDDDPIHRRAKKALVELSEQAFLFL